MSSVSAVAGVGSLGATAPARTEPRAAAAERSAAPRDAGHRAVPLRPERPPLAPDAIDAGSLYSVTHGAGVLVSTKAGPHWTTWQLDGPPSVITPGTSASQALETIRARETDSDGIDFTT